MGGSVKGFTKVYNPTLFPLRVGWGVQLPEKSVMQQTFERPLMADGSRLLAQINCSFSDGTKSEIVRDLKNIFCDIDIHNVL